MSQNYRSETRAVLINHLTYNEEERCYKVYVSFLYENWLKSNQVELVFDDNGDFLKTEEIIYSKFRNKTLEETKEDHVKYAISYKEAMEKLVKILMKPIQKESVRMNQEKHINSDYTLRLNFETNDLSYNYILDMHSPYGNKLECVFEENSDWFFIELHNIPSLIELKRYVRNHPNVRVKFVNELACYEKRKRKLEKSLNVNLDDL